MASVIVPATGSNYRVVVSTEIPLPMRRLPSENASRCRYLRGATLVMVASSCFTLTGAIPLSQTGEAGTVLEGTTSRPSVNTFVAGEKVGLVFSARGLAASSGKVTLQLRFVREHFEEAGTAEVKVEADGSGNWHGTAPGLVDKNRPLGFYRVYAQLSTGTKLAPQGTREQGYLTYAIVPDPAARRDYGELKSRVGMQGSFTEATNIAEPLLGTRWIIVNDDWTTLEPQRPGQLTSSRAAALARHPVFATSEKQGSLPYAGSPRSPVRHATGPLRQDLPASHASYGGNRWDVYVLSVLQRASLPRWALDKATSARICSSFGMPNAEGVLRWPRFAEEMAKAYAEDWTDIPEHLYQITWEPANPWCFTGTAAQLVSYYSSVYTAIHKADAKAMVLGPTLFPDTTGTNMKQMEALWDAGLAKYLDGVAMHPYSTAYPPERNGFIEALRTQLTLANNAAGRGLPFYGTEHCYRSKSSRDELDQALGNIRQTLIVLGEGAQFDFSFFLADFIDPSTSTTGGFGFYSNLDPQTRQATNQMSPKPGVPALAALTLFLDGSDSKGPLAGLGANSIGYRFERAGKTILALWNYGSIPHNEVVPVPTSSVSAYDWMGNKSNLQVTDGRVSVSLGPDPIYLIY